MSRIAKRNDQGGTDNLLSVAQRQEASEARYVTLDLLSRQQVVWATQLVSHRET
jgi:hypothetical protein